MIGQQVLSYKILRQLGAGGMGIVYEAEDTRLGRHVALKFLPPSLDASPEAAARFEREARIASSINHPNICTIYDIGALPEGARTRHFIVMELLEGESLKTRIHGQPLPIEQVIDVGHQIGDALDAAHAQSIVHRDVKPANIFLTKRGQAKLLDFGIAKPGGDSPDAEETRAHAEALTTAGTTVGSVHYMSPEQARGESLDGRTDIFSLGLVLYEMAAGRQAFAGQTTAVVYDAILNRDPVAPRELNAEVPEELSRVIMRALEKDRRLRYQTAGDLVADLKRLRRDTDARRLSSSGSLAAAPLAPVTGSAPIAAAPGLATSSAPAATATTMAVPAARPRWIWLAAAAILVSAAGGFWWWQSNRAPAFTERGLILVADFANSTGDAVFDDALKQAVSVQLQQTPFVTLLADQQIQRTLRLMQRPSDVPVVGAVAREVCQRAGARATVEGSIAPIGSSYVIALGVHDCQTGAPIAQEQTQADSKEGVLKAVGGAVTALRTRLGESLASIQKNDVPAEATTASLEALRAYGLAVKTRSTKGDEASLPLFRQAIEHDPNFALAYAKAGVVSANLGLTDDAKAATQKAYDLRDRVSEYERLYILWSYYSRVAPDDVKAKETLDILTTTYPRDFSARNNLGTYYMGKGKFEDAFAQFKTAHEIAPAEPLPASNAAYALMNLGRFDEAMTYADQAMAIRQDRNLALTRWVHAHAIGDAREAAYKEVAVKLAPEEQMQAILSGFATWDGRTADYARLEADRLARSRAAGKAADVVNLEWNDAMTRAVVLGGTHVAELKGRLSGPAVTPQMRAQAAAVLAIAGEVEPARSNLAKLTQAQSAGQVEKETLAIVRAYVLVADGHLDDALAGIQSVRKDDPRQYAVYFNIGQIQERGGKADDAIVSYQKVVDVAPALGLNFTTQATRLALGRLLAARGDAAGARTQFDILKKQWAHADPDYPPALELKKLAGG